MSHKDVLGNELALGDVCLMSAPKAMRQPIPKLVHVKIVKFAPKKVHVICRMESARSYYNNQWNKVSGDLEVYDWPHITLPSLLVKIPGLTFTEIITVPNYGDS